MYIRIESEMYKSDFVKSISESILTIGEMLVTEKVINYSNVKVKLYEKAISKHLNGRYNQKAFMNSIKKHLTDYELVNDEFKCELFIVKDKNFNDIVENVVFEIKAENISAIIYLANKEYGLITNGHYFQEMLSKAIAEKRYGKKYKILTEMI